MRWWCVFVCVRPALDAGTNEYAPGSGHVGVGEVLGSGDVGEVGDWTLLLFRLSTDGRLLVGGEEEGKGKEGY